MMNCVTGYEQGRAGRCLVTAGTYPVRDGEPGDAVVFDDGGGAEERAGVGDEPGHGEDAEVGEEDGVALAGVEYDRVRCVVSVARWSGRETDARSKWLVHLG
jgi:hypothetical protein